MTHRPSGRNLDQLRAVSFECGYAKNAEGSCFIKMGNTHVLCTATFEEQVPRWLKGSGGGWLTAEYGMLPRSTNSRMRREATSGKQSGRTQEIQRLIGRSLRAALDLKKLGERQITIDCDVIQADGGTRTASITGAWLALKGCIEWLYERDLVTKDVLKTHIAAISCGIYQGQAVLDLDYAEDSEAEVDCNFVITGEQALVEVQGSAEGQVFTKEEFDTMYALASKGCADLINLQKFAG